MCTCSSPPSATADADADAAPGGWAWPGEERGAHAAHPPQLLLLLLLLHQVVGPDQVKNVVRMQLARQPPGAMVRMHRDMGGYSKRSHRIHIPIVNHENVKFEVGGRGRAGRGGAERGRAGQGRGGRDGAVTQRIVLWSLTGLLWHPLVLLTTVAVAVAPALWL